MEAYLLYKHPSNSSRQNLIIIALSIIMVIGIIILVLIPNPSHNASSSLDISSPFLDNDNGDLYELYQHWKQHYHKLYESPQENEYRFQIFVQNYKWIINHNANAHSSYKVGLNQFADLTQDEFRAMYLNSHKLQENPAHIKYFSTEDLPFEVNWTSKGAVTPVQDQGPCAVGWAFSAAGAMEGLNFNQSSKLIAFSEQQLIDCSGAYGTQGCMGGWMEQAFQYASQFGIQTFNSYPYTQAQQNCAYNPEHVVFSISGFKNLAENNNDQILAAVAMQPVSAPITVDRPGFQFYKSGIYDDTECGTSLNHGVLIVGYGITNNTDYWYLKNSWGVEWGLDGYMMIKRDTGIAPGICGIAIAASIPELQLAIIAISQNKKFCLN